MKNTANHTELTFCYMRVDGKLETLLDFLLRRFRYLDSEGWLENIREGRLLVDSQRGKPLQILKGNQKIIYRRPDFMEPEVDSRFETLYEDEYLIALNKSGNLPTSPSGRYFKNTLVNIVKDKLNVEKLYTLHRLDRETSGVILFAKQHPVAQSMAAMFRNKEIKKKYIAILEKSLPSPEVFLSLPIGPDPTSDIRIKQGVFPEGKLSQTYFRQIETVGTYAKVEVQPITGRTHQIRVHAAYMGNPVVGDKMYGLKNDGFLHWKEEGEDYLKAQNFPTHRQLLHASEVCFTHPVTRNAVRIQADEQTLMQHLL